MLLDVIITGGGTRHVFTEGRYCCMGPQVQRASRGVSDSSYHQDLMDDNDWDAVIDVVQWMESIFTSFVRTEEIRKLNLAKALIGFKTLSSTRRMNMSDEEMKSIFSGCAFGYNTHLISHSDIDFTQSMTSVYLNGHINQDMDRIVAFFCFPRLGIAVPLRPGDVLVFNPLEPHAISSRCKNSDRLLCLSLYLKTGVVGLNDNLIPLSVEEERRHSIFRSMKKI